MPTTLGKYEIRREIGAGAMGTVYEAWDPFIRRAVAIKTMLQQTSPDPETVQSLARFRREAEAAGRLIHPNIVTVYDYGEADGIAYIVMELVDGGSLKEKLDREERLSLPVIAQIMDGLLIGLQFSHDHGVVHRDIKPGNVMLTRGGEVKIADFGVARIDDSTLTQAGGMLGTLAYMSPEQLMGERADARSDIYSCGVLLYHLLTGVRPFRGQASAIMHQVLYTAPPLPSEAEAACPPAFDGIVRKAMAKMPEDRFTSAAEFAAALRLAASPVPKSEPEATATVVRPPVVHERPAPVTVKPVTVEPVTVKPVAPGRHPLVGISVAVATIAIAVVIGYLVLGLKKSGNDAAGGTQVTAEAERKAAEDKAAAARKAAAEKAAAEAAQQAAAAAQAKSAAEATQQAAAAAQAKAAAEKAAAEAARKSIEPEMVRIHAGRFTMGVPPAEEEQENVPSSLRGLSKPHDVTFAHDFFLGKYAVTRAEYARFVSKTGPRPAGGCWTWEKGKDSPDTWAQHDNLDWRNPGFPQTDRDPVVCVSAKDAEDYAAWLSKETGLPYRLPSEAEWEYAARAGTKTARYWDNTRGEACGFANAADRALAKAWDVLVPDPENFVACSDGFAFTAPVGSFKANDFGLHDMLGNVYQWTADAWHDDYYGAPSNGSAWIEDGDEERRPLRGGSWNVGIRNIRAGLRIDVSRDYRNGYSGFRLARTLSP